MAAWNCGDDAASERGGGASVATACGSWRRSGGEWRLEAAADPEGAASEVAAAAPWRGPGALRVQGGGGARPWRRVGGGGGADRGGATGSGAGQGWGSPSPLASA